MHDVFAWIQHAFEWVEHGAAWLFSLLFGWIPAAAKWLLAFAKEHPASAFLIAFVVSFGESFAGLSFLVPGTTILIGLGAVLRMTDTELLGFWPTWAAAALGAILGDWISYWFGHRYHEHVLDMWPIKRYRAQMTKIGRASCRERVYIAVGAGTVKEKN